MELGSYVVMAVAAYLLGSIPTGFVVAQAKGIDIRRTGSGNIGATNVLRALGKPAGILVLVVDGLKGYAACAWVADLILKYVAPPQTSAETMRIIAGLAAVVGHNYTCWLHFKGGKGIATSAGVLAALVPISLVIIGGVWMLVFVLTWYVSLASIMAAFTLPFATWATRGGNLTLILVTAAMAALAIYKHKGNIQRLLQGTENRFGSRHKEVQS